MTLPSNLPCSVGGCVRNTNDPECMVCRRPICWTHAYPIWISERRDIPEGYCHKDCEYWERLTHEATNVRVATGRVQRIFFGRLEAMRREDGCKDHEG